MTQGELILGLMFQYVENWDYQDDPIATFKTKDYNGDWAYTKPELIKLIDQSNKLGLVNEELERGLIELTQTQEIYDRIVPTANVHSFYS